MQQLKHGDKIKLKTGEKGIFEDYDIVNKRKCFVIIEPDFECKGSQLVNLSDVILVIG